MKIRNDMYFTTLCYLQKDGKYLMLHRTKKKDDINSGKYIGLGGHIEKGESPEECIKREILEEAGILVNNLLPRGIITFVMGDVDEYSFLYTSDDFTPTEKYDTAMQNCDEGVLRWVETDKISALPLWEGDKYFLPLLAADIPFFSLKLVYDKENTLLSVLQNGKEIMNKE